MYKEQYWNQISNKSMKYKLYLDDVRETPNGFNATVRSYDEFVAFVDKHFHDIEFISFDHDLQDYNMVQQPTGYDCLKYFINKCIAENVELPNIALHTANPVGAQNMRNLYHDYIRENNVKNNRLKKRFY